MFPLFVRVFFTKLRDKSRSSDRLRLQFVAHAQSRFRPNPFRRDISALVASLARDLAVLVCASRARKTLCLLAISFSDAEQKRARSVARQRCARPGPGQSVCHFLLSQGQPSAFFVLFSVFRSFPGVFNVVVICGVALLREWAFVQRC